MWSGQDGTDASQALATCGEGAVAVAYSIDPDTQAWSRWFADRPDISTLTALDDMQGVLTLGAFEPTPTITPIPSPTPPLALTVHFIDVGQGDAILIDSGDTDILLDGGQAFANVEDYLQAQGIDDIDLMVATHPDADHIGGLIDVLALYDVHEIWTNGDTAGSQTYGDFALAVAQEQAAGAILREVTRGYVAKFGDLDIVVLHPPSLTGDTNEDSLVIRLTFGMVDILLTGDATTESEVSMLAEEGLLTDVEVLKVAHHGSNTSTSDAFLTAVTPEDAVISVGAGNTYGHPHQQTLDRLAAHGVTPHRRGWDSNANLRLQYLLHYDQRPSRDPDGYCYANSHAHADTTITSGCLRAVRSHRLQLLRLRHPGSGTNVPRCRSQRSFQPGRRWRRRGLRVAAVGKEVCNVPTTFNRSARG